MKPLKVILVDDNLAFRVALKKLLAAEYNVEIIGEASNANEYRAIDDLHLADIVFMDVMMPGVDGITLAKETHWIHHRLKTIAITMHVDKVYLDSLIGAGFKGCIFKNNLYAELHAAINNVMAGKLHYPKNININK
jgi:two-component system, NarL family, response regulator NreC